MYDCHIRRHYNNIVMIINNTEEPPSMKYRMCVSLAKNNLVQSRKTIDAVSVRTDQPKHP